MTVDLSQIVLPEMDEEKQRAGAREMAAISLPFNIDNWPEDVAALSMPTTLIPVDPVRICDIYEGDKGVPVMQEYAREIDAITGWRQHFIKLNSRSPKDATAPGLPITCSGKQAMAWLASSERALDDISLLRLADEPIFIAVREWLPIDPELEFRCFAKDGRVLGVSRYDYPNPAADSYDPIWIENMAAAFYDTHLQKHYDTVVFDLAFGTEKRNPLLIELNPYGLSDPCCFSDYHNIENIGGFANEMMESL